MPNYTDQRLAELARLLRDQVAHTSDWHTQYRGAALALVEDLQAVRSENETLRYDMEGLDGEIAHLEAEVTRLDKTVAELNASNQQLAQTIKDIDAACQRNAERFKAIMKIASETPKLPECVPAFAAIWTFANAGAQEEGDKP
jgi:chromosome segregation ATPase